MGSSGPDFPHLAFPFQCSAASGLLQGSSRGSLPLGHCSLGTGERLWGGTWCPLPAPRTCPGTGIGAITASQHPTERGCPRRLRFWGKQQHRCHGEAPAHRGCAKDQVLEHLGTSTSCWWSKGGKKKRGWAAGRMCPSTQARSAALLQLFQLPKAPHQPPPPLHVGSSHHEGVRRAHCAQISFGESPKPHTTEPPPSLQEPSRCQKQPAAARGLCRGVLCSLLPGFAAPSSRAEPSGAGSPGTQLTLLRQRLPELGKTRAAACKWKCPAEPFEEASEGRKGRQREEMAPNFWSPRRREHTRPRAGSLRLPLLSRSHCSTRHSALRQPSPPAHLHLHTVFIPSKTQEGEDSSPVGHWGAASSPEGFEQQNPPSSTCSEAAVMVLHRRQAPELVPTPWHSYWHGVVPGGSHGTTFPGGKVFPSQPHSVVPSGEPSSRAGLQDAGTLVPGVLLVVSPKGAAPGAAGCL